MISFLILAAVSAVGGIVAWIFKSSVMAFFKPASPAQQAVNQQRKMDQEVIDPLTRDQAVKKLEDGDA